MMQKIPKAPAVKELTARFAGRPNGYVFGMKLTIWLGSLVLGAKLALASDIATESAGTILLGLMFAHGVELQHQAVHSTGFCGRRSNELAGMILGLPMLVSYAAYQASHLRHHRLMGTPENREYFNYGDQYGSRGLAGIINIVRRCFMIPHHIAFIRNLVRSTTFRKFPGETPAVSQRMRGDHFLMATAIIVMLALNVIEGGGIVVRLWLLPFLVIACPIHALIELPEHFRCETGNPDAFRNTRSITSNSFMTWFTNGNNFHVEHHLLPGAPVERLPEMHESIRPYIRHYEAGYVAFLGSLFSAPVIRNEAPIGQPNV